MHQVQYGSHTLHNLHFSIFICIKVQGLHMHQIQGLQMHQGPSTPSALNPRNSYAPRSKDFICTKFKDIKSTSVSMLPWIKLHLNCSSVVFVFSSSEFSSWELLHETSKFWRPDFFQWIIIALTCLYRWQCRNFLARERHCAIWGNFHNCNFIDKSDKYCELQ